MSEALAVHEVDTTRRIWQVATTWRYDPGTWGWECLLPGCGDWEGMWPTRATAEQRHANHRHITTTRGTQA